MLGKRRICSYYATQDEAHRQDKLWRHKIGNKDADELLYTEDDEIYSASFQKSRSGNYTFLLSSSSETSGVSFIDLDKPSEPPQLIAKRQQGLIYEFDDFAGSFYIVTNKDKATNFKLMKTSVTLSSPEHWIDVFPYDESIKVDIVLNMRPDLFTAAFAGVPYVDVMNTMSDASIPLTTGEWEE